jgi:hypothetical protein
MEKTMKRSSLIVFLLAAAAVSAAPANAKTSITKGHKICEEAAEKQEPAPKFARADRDETTVNNETITVRLKVKNADDSLIKVVCRIDRETGAPTLTPAS